MAGSGPNGNLDYESSWILEAEQFGVGLVVPIPPLDDVTPLRIEHFPSTVVLSVSVAEGEIPLPLMSPFDPVQVLESLVPDRALSLYAELVISSIVWH
jgi:hypothetical protein